MRNSYNKLNKKGRFWFWWFASCNLAILVFLVIMSLLTYTIFKQQRQLEQQQSTISKLKRENDSNTASILRLVAYIENVGVNTMEQETRLQEQELGYLYTLKLQECIDNFNRLIASSARGAYIALSDG